MKLLWLGYLAYSLSNCAIKLCTETSLRGKLSRSFVSLNAFFISFIKQGIICTLCLRSKHYFNFNFKNIFPNTKLELQQGLV
jgi:non-homologous end joining protein Ku